MRILHVTPAYYPAFDHGGPIRAMLELDMAFARIGVGLDVLTTNTHRSANLDVPLDDWIEKNGVRIRYMPRVGRSTYSFSPQQLKYFISHVGEYDACFLTSLFTFSSAAFSVVMAHKNMTYWVSPRGLNLEKRKPFKLAHLALFERRLYQKAKFVHVTSQEERHQLARANLGKNYILAPNSVNLSAPKLPVEIHRYTSAGVREKVETNGFLKNLLKSRFFYFGSISRVKNVYSLVEAFCSNEVLRESVLVIIGPDDRDERARIINSFGDRIGKNIEIVDRLNANEIHSLAPSLGISVHPATYENFSNSLIEISQLKIPAIISAGIGALEFISREGCVVFDPATKFGLTDALTKALFNFSQLQKESSSRKIILNSWDENARVLLNAIQNPSPSSFSPA